MSNAFDAIDNAAGQAASVYDHLLNSKPMMESVHNQGQVMRKVMKQYQLAGFTQDQAFE